MLGELSDELEGIHITDWLGSGPKSYSYLTSTEKLGELSDDLEGTHITDWDNFNKIC